MTTHLNHCRENTLNCQIRPYGGLDDAANQALQSVPRELFAPSDYQTLAFADIAIKLADDAFMLKPTLEGRLLKELMIKKQDNVLEIGTGSGYLSAVLAKLANHVTTVDINEQLSAQAQARTKKLTIDNITFMVSDASQAILKNKHFDVIVFGVAVPHVEKHYLDWLAIGGRLFITEGVQKYKTAKLIRRLGDDDWQTKSLFETELTTMIGLKQKTTFSF